MKSKNPGAPHSAQSRKQQRREDAEERQAARNARTDEQQLKLIAKRRGESRKERTRLGGRKR